MRTSIEEIERFAEFARQTALHAGAPSLEECLRQWREEQELAETIEDIKRGVADIEAGRYMTLEEADRQIRASLGVASSENMISDSMPHFVTERRVQFSETDMAGIVHFANFFRWMEEAEHEYFRSIGLTIVAKQDGAVHIGWPRVAASCNFHLPLFYQDVFEVRVTVERLGVKSISYHFELWRAGDHIATGRLKVACCLCGPEGIIRSIEIPGDYLERLPQLD